MLTTARLVLRPPRVRDAQSIARYANNRSVWLGLRDAFPHPYTVDDAKRFIASAGDERPPLTFGIEHEGDVIGIIGLIPKSDIFRHSAELGYWLGEPLWGRGLATEAVNGVASHAFGELGLERIYAFVFSSNPASVKVLEKAGFTCEGILRNGAIKDGQLLDTHLYAKLRSGHRG